MYSSVLASYEKKHTYGENQARWGLAAQAQQHATESSETIVS